MRVALAALAASALACAGGARPVAVGSKNFSEQVILGEIVAQNEKIAAYVKKLESRDAEADQPPAPAGQSDLPPASELVAEIEQFLRQQRPE